MKRRGKRPPKPWRKKNPAGKETGNYWISSGGDINLGTSDANEAHDRMRDHLRTGRRNFVDEIDEAADATEPGGELEEQGGAHNPAAGGATPRPATAPTALPAAAATASTAQAPPVRPDAVFPPGGPHSPLQLPAMQGDDRAEAEATNDAAAEGDGDQADAGDGGAQAIPADVIDSFLEQGAGVIVDLQLELQAAIIRKRTNKQPARVPDDSPVRKMAAAAWVAQLKIWIPPDKMLPPWALALLLPAMCLPQQLASAVPIKKPEEGEAAATPAEPAAAAA